MEDLPKEKFSDEKTRQFIKEFAKRMVANQKNIENQKYGKFIIQANEVQFYLSILVSLQSSPFADKKYNEYIESATLNQVVNLFCASAKNIKDVGKLVKSLREYNNKRDRLAHKMFSSKKLKKGDCELAIKNGEEILKSIKITLKQYIPDIKII